MIFKNPVFLIKFKIWYILDHTIWFKLLKRRRDFRHPLLEFATEARKIFKFKFNAKIVFQIWHFMIPFFKSDILWFHYWRWHWKSKIFFIHYLISIWATCWWNLNKIVWYEIYKILSFSASIFEKVLTRFKKSFCDINTCSILKY